MDVDNFIKDELKKPETIEHFTKSDVEICNAIAQKENQAVSVLDFIKSSKNLSPYAYWRFLGLIYMKGGIEDMTPDIWRTLFTLNRPHQEELMLAKEKEMFAAFPDEFDVFRVHHPNETDWISYTFSLQTASLIKKAYVMHGTYSHISHYMVKKQDVQAGFLRHFENEIIILDKSKVRLVESPLKAMK